MRRSVGLVLLAACGSSAPPARPATEDDRPADPIAADQLRGVEDLVGKPAPAFTVKDVRTGAPIVVPAPGKVIILYFTGNWTPGARWGAEGFNRLRAKYPALNPIGVSVDEDERSAKDLADYVHAEFPFGWRTSPQPGHPLLEHRYAQDVYSPNAVFLIDAKGIVRFAHRGGKEHCAAKQLDVEDEVAELLGAPPPLGAPPRSQK